MKAGQIGFGGTLHDLYPERNRMDGALAAPEASAPAQALRLNRWAWAGASAARILGIALLIGAIIPLDLRLPGTWPRVPHAVLARGPVPAVATGLALALLTGVLLTGVLLTGALLTGALLCGVRATIYAGLPVLWLKPAQVSAGTLPALSLHAAHGWWLDGATPARLRRHAVLSAPCRIGALICGRLIAVRD
jgi:hypothetical protein